MIYTVIYMEDGEYKSKVVQSSIDRQDARLLMAQQYGYIIAMIPGSHPVYF